MEARQPSVLVIDDDEAMREYVCFILKKAGFLVMAASNGVEGLSLVKEQVPDVIITDLIMPEKEGLETIREIRELHPQCGIIAMSGAANSITYLAMADCLGAQIVMQKPLNREQVLGAVKTTLAAQAV